METWLSNHAASHAWQRPYLDGQLIIAGRRLTPRRGGTSFVRESITRTPMPGPGYWHIYHLGKLHLNYGNLALGANLWTRVSTCINAFSAFILLYNEAGISLPAHSAWLYRRGNGEVVLAVPQAERYNWVENDTLYIRFYPGYNGGANAPLINPTSVQYLEIPSIKKRQDALDQYYALRSSAKGWVTFWINGKCLDAPTANDIALWDDVEIRIDGRVKRVVDFVCGDLQTYLSTLDSKRKYLLHLPKQSIEWTFNNDIEIQVMNGREIRYYHLHRHQAIRNLTFNDVAIPTERIAQLRNAFDTVPDIDTLKIRLLIRDDFLDLAPLFNTDHVQDLYRLDDAGIISAMVGANANVVEWQAANLEQSAANRLAAAQRKNITRDLATDAYGYNAITRYCADTPQRLVLDARGWGCSLPALLAVESTVYEYDADGLLLGAYPNVNNTLYYARNSKARMVEAIVGTAGKSVKIVDNAPDFTLVHGENVSLYLRTVKSGVPQDVYEKAVEDTDYTRNGDLITWKVDRTRRAPTVIYDSQHLFFEYDVKVTEGVIRVPILAENQTGEQRTLWIPMETVEVWMNGHPLVHSIDYVSSWPEFVVVCKAWTSDTDTNRIAVRVRGVTGELKIPKCGFVANGLFSNNSHFDVRDDKVIRIVAGGGLLLREDVVFREDATVGSDVVADGFPFSVDDPTIPLRDVASGDTYVLRDKARDQDRRIEDYLSNWIPTPPPNPIVDLANWYHLFSPVLNKILWDRKQGLLDLVEDDPDVRISTKQLDEIMKAGYENLLKFDPAYFGYDKIFVKVHPHMQYTVMEVDELTFAFCDRVNQRYLQGNVQLNQYLKIKG